MRRCDASGACLASARASADISPDRPVVHDFAWSAYRKEARTGIVDVCAIIAKLDDEVPRVIVTRSRAGSGRASPGTQLADAWSRRVEAVCLTSDVAAFLCGPCRALGA